MGVAPYKTFTFDGVSSANYDVYLTGVGVYNAPQRSVEMLSIAGRNGDYALDQGKFENITVTYKVGMYDTDENNFATKVSNFRNWLCSKVGYVRLEDEYNPNEYRMAVYSDGFELDHDMLIAGEAEITFNCKPQRWLTSGETATAVANNGTLSNPTLFDSEPLLAVKGYGTIGFNGYSIDIENAVLGTVQVSTGKTGQVSGKNKASYSYTRTVDVSNLNSADAFTVNGVEMTITHKAEQMTHTGSAGISSTTNASAEYNRTSSDSCAINIVLDDSAFNYGTSGSLTATVGYTVIYRTGGTGHTTSVTATCVVSYNGSNTLTYSCTLSQSPTNTTNGFIIKSPDVFADSTKSMLGNPTYIDCDIGECYMYNSNNEIVSLNGNIDLGSDLPKLASGTNTFTYDNTVTELKVTPRWWKV